MTKTETGTMLSRLAEIWSNEPITPGKIDMYHALLSRFDFADVMAAAITHTASSEFFPKPAHLLRLLSESQVHETTIGEATQLIQKQINAHSARFEDVTFDDPCVMDAVKAVGWTRIRLEDRAKGDFVTRDLEAALNAAQERRRRGVQDGTAALGAGNVVALDRRAS